MSAELEILGITKVTTEPWDQPRDEVVDVSAYTDAAIVCTVFAGTVAGGSTTTVWLQTAVQNAEERWSPMANLCSYIDNPVPPETHYLYLQGSGAGDTGQPGFGKYLRIHIDQNVASEITLDVRAIMKP